MGDTDKVFPNPEEGPGHHADVGVFGVDHKMYGANKECNGHSVLHEMQKQSDDGEKNKDVVVKKQVVGFFQLFRFSDKLDKVCIVLGVIVSIIHGLGYPINLLIYGDVLDLFIQDEIAKHSNLTDSNGGPSLFDAVQIKSIYFALVATGVFIFAFLQMLLWMTSAERQARRIRQLFLHKVLNQSIGWYDTHETAEISSRLAEDVARIQDGTGDKMGTFIQWMSTFVGGYTLGFIRGWKLALVMMSFTPLVVIAFIITAKTIQKYSALQIDSYARAGAIAEEALSSIRTVVAFGGEKKESLRYDKNLETARKVGVKKGLFMGLCVGFVWVLIFGLFALAMWYASKLVREDGLSGGHVLQVFMGVLFGSMSLGHAAPTLEQIAGARGAAASIFSIIDLESEIDPSSEDGEKPEIVEGNIEFEEVSFIYPTRPEVKVLENISITVKVGQTVALVGASGCGKSTTVQLLQRFYDPIDGLIKLDGKDIRDLNIKWLRQQIGVVSQEPILFSTTVAENIRYGREGVSDKEVENAAKEANAHDFIMSLPKAYSTLVGERGAQMSGGQKQRIAIARALVRNPKILLLDEATSALDTESESVVQDALDKARKGRTTLVIAHRLSTVKNADLIIGMDQGKVVEVGSNDELMERGGIYYTLATNQMLQNEKEKNKTAPKFTGLLSQLSVIIDNEQELDMGATDEPLLKGNKIMYDVTDSLYHSNSSFRSGIYNRQQSSKSVKSDVSLKEEEDAELEKLPPVPFKRLIRLNAPETPYIIVGAFSAIFVGAMHPVFGAVFSEILGNFAEISPSAQSRQSVMFSLIIFGVGLIGSIANVLQSYFFSLSGENLTMRLRQLSFRAMLRQNIGWFDDKNNQVGALTTRLSTDAAMVQGATGSQLGVVVQGITTISAGVLIAFIFGWKLAFVVVGFLPFTIAGGIIQSRVFAGRTTESKKMMEEAGKISSEGVDNIRTVQSLSLEDRFENEYAAFLDKIFKRSIRKILVFSVFFGMAQCIMFYSYAATFGFGSYLVDRGEMLFKDVIKVFAAVTFSGMALGRASSTAPDMSKGKISAAKIFRLIDRTPEIDSSNQDGDKPSDCSGEVNFSGAKFSYPTRPGIQVLKGLDLWLKPGQTLALVGSSGCGKSTTVQLIERFYDTTSGVVNVDGKNIKELNVQWLRNQLGIVSQEPILFDTSIKDNIAYGDNTREVPMSDVIDVARKANIHNFIESLPMGYETNVGDKGTQLSGGQKQRVAIARALIRNPKVLLLDEATSALDTESEKVVQEALDKAREGRTCVMIAHRLSTIKNADIIAVIHAGTVVEQGTHSELMARKDYYYRLHQVQHRTKKDEPAD